MHVRLVWGLLGVFGAAIFVTYSRLPPEELYNVSEEGLAGGAGRALVYLNYPVSLVAIPIAWLSAERIANRWAIWAAAAATVLCAVTAWPGVVDKDDLDAKLINVVPALGVVIAFVLSVKAHWDPPSRLALDGIRLGIGIVVWVFALGWVFSVLGFHVPGDVLLAEELRRGGEGTIYAAVHLGDNEGLDAALLVTSALVLSRFRPAFPVLALLGLMFVYGLAVEWADFWFEQVVKRGWTTWRPPAVLNPRLSVAWLTLALLAVAVAVAVRRFEGPPQPGEGPPRTGPSPARAGPSAGSTTDEPSP